MIKNFEIRAPDLKDITGGIEGIGKQSSGMLSRSINRAATTAKTAIGRSKTGAPSVYRIKSGEVNSASKIIKKADTKNLIAVISVKGRSRPLIKFAVSPKRLAKRHKSSGNPKSYKAAVMKSGSLKNLDHLKNKPFFAITKNGTEGIFSRKDSKIQKQIRIVRRLKGKGVRVYTYKTKVKTGEPYQTDILQMHFGPSVPQMVENNDVMSRIQKEANRTLQKRLDHEVSRYLERLKK